MMPIATLDDTLGPLLRRLARHRGPLTLAAYQAAHVAHIRQQPGVQIHVDQSGPVTMHVNHNRWLGICSHCGSGMMTGRGWAEVRCFECGAIYQALWPAHVDAIEALLAARPVPNRNWQPTETLEYLAADNIEHGLASAGV